MKSRIRAIHQFGPAVGKYVRSDFTNIRVTFKRARRRILAAKDERIPSWLSAHAADEKADLERAMAAIDADDRR